MKILTIIFCFITTICISQKQYDFDYVIEYEVNQNKDSIKIENPNFRSFDEKKQLIFLTNSINNDFTAVITEKDSLNYRMVFQDDKFGIFADVFFLKEDLNRAKFIKINCEYVRKFSIADKVKTKNHDFINLKDTIINGKSFSRYKLIELESKRIKKGTEFYIIDKSTDNHLPILDSMGAYEAGKDNEKLPNGILIEKYFVDFNGKLSYLKKNVKYFKAIKKIIIVGKCLNTEKN